MKSYFLHKNNDTKENVYIEYDKLDGYELHPKLKNKDMIEVNKIIFVSPSFSEKLIKKKIDKKIKYLLDIMSIVNEDDDEGNATLIRDALMEAERLKIMLMNTYIKYLGKAYYNLTLKKIQVLINQLRVDLYMLKDKEMMSLSYIDENRGRGR